MTKIISLGSIIVHLIQLEQYSDFPLDIFYPISQIWTYIVYYNSIVSIISSLTTFSLIILLMNCLVSFAHLMLQFQNLLSSYFICSNLCQLITRENVAICFLCGKQKTRWHTLDLQSILDIQKVVTQMRRIKETLLVLLFFILF